MEQTNNASALLPMRTTRAGVSRKLLTRKALERMDTSDSQPLEASFPSEGDDLTEGSAGTSMILAEPSESSPAASATPHGPTPGIQPAWSNEDEAGFQALVTRRKAAGYKRRGKDLAAQVMQPGAIKPNPDTVVATIVGLVGDRMQLNRHELLGLMATAVFPHPKARPADTGWCQGYISGAIRSGCLMVVDEASVASGKGA